MPTVAPCHHPLPFIQVAGSTFRSANWCASPQRTLCLESLKCSELAPLLAALQPPGAGPLEELCLLKSLNFLRDVPAVAADVAAAAPRLAQLRALEVSLAPCARTALAPGLGGALEPLLRQLPNLEALRLIGCELSSLPDGPYLTGVESGPG